LKSSLVVVAVSLLATAVPLRSTAGKTASLLAPTWVYDFSTYVVPGALTTVVEAINNKNDIAGVFTDPSSGWGNGFVLANGTLTTFAAADANTTIPLDMNDSGTLVGFFQRSGQIHGFLYSGGILSPAPYGETQFTLENRPTSINNHGNIVGWYSWGFPFLPNPIFYFTYFDAQTFTGPPIGTSGDLVLEAVNDASHVAASYQASQFLISESDARPITHDGALSLLVDDVNNLDAAVGSVTDATFEHHGFVWTNGKSVTVDYPGGINTNVLGINDAGIIVGSYLDPAASATRGFIATPRSPVDVKINGGDGPVTRDRTAPLRVDLSFQAPPEGSLDPAELYVGVVTPVGVLWIDPARGFVTTPTRAFAGPLPGFGLPLIDLPNGLAFPPGTYTWFALVDDDTDGVPNSVFSDFAQVTLQ
jgi:hypothetical protein